MCGTLACRRVGRLLIHILNMKPKKLFEALAGNWRIAYCATSISGLSKLYRFQLRRKKLNTSKRDHIRRSGDEERNHVAARPLQRVADDLSDQHSSNRPGHAAHSDHRTHCLRWKHI